MALAVLACVFVQASCTSRNASVRVHQELAADFCIHETKVDGTGLARLQIFIGRFDSPFDCLSAGSSSAFGTTIIGGVSLTLPSIAACVVLLKKAAS